MNLKHLSFVRENRKKPHHEEAVELTLYPVLCKGGCGLFYVSVPAPGTDDDRCSECGRMPLKSQVGQAERVMVSVVLAFGNVRKTEFLRSLGPAAAQRTVQRRPLIFHPTSVLSTAEVSTKE